MSRRRTSYDDGIHYFILNMFLVNLHFAHCSQQVIHFKYLGCQISYENEKNIFNKNDQYCSNPGNFNNTFKPRLI
jgi:hypothetical protein